MSVYFFSTVWAFAENPSDLDSITNEQMIELACVPGHSPNEGEEWLTKARAERAGEIQKRTPHMMKIHAGGSLGHCMRTEELSKLYPNLLFIEVDGADCSDDLRLYYTKDGKNILKCEIEESDKILPGGLSLRELESTSFDKVKLAFDEIKFLGQDLFLHGSLDEITEPPFGMEDEEK